MARKTRRSTKRGGEVAPRPTSLRTGSVAASMASAPRPAASVAPAVERTLFNKLAEVNPGMEDRADRFKSYESRLGSVKEALNPAPTEAEMGQFGSKRRRSRRKSKKITRRRK